MPKKFSWSWPAFRGSAVPFGWRDTWGALLRTGGADASYGWDTDRSDRLADDDSKLELARLPPVSVIALVGLAFEARIAAGPGVLVICQGAGGETAELLQVAVRDGCRSIISFGVAGGLAPDLLPGDCVVASAIVDYPTLRPTDPIWSRKLLEAIPDVRHGTIVGVNSPVADPADKRRLHTMTGAVAVDMESHLVARLAASHGLAFAAVRVVVDPAHRVVPAAAMLAMGPNRSADVSSMVREILARPSQLGGLMRIAADAYAARSTLVRLRRALGPDFSWR